MRRLITICLLALSATALLVAPPAASGAKKKAAKKPSVTRVTPMRISVGNTLTIRGKNFSPKRRSNTVIFRGPSGRSAFVKPRRASRTKLVVVLPTAVGRLLRGEFSDPRPTRLKLRVLSSRRFSKFTSRRLSPVVTGFGEGDGGRKGGGDVKPPCTDSDDHDGDLLSNALEGQIGTDRCKADTDGDGVEDGYEYKSAIDLNDDEFQQPNTTLPYPGKRPYPNALDPSDAGRDFDGDVLTLAEEQKLWRYTGVRTLFDLTYSDGEQYSMRTRDGNNRRVPSLAVAGYGKHAEFLAWASGAGYRNVMLSDGTPWWSGSTRNSYGLLDFNRDGSESTVQSDPYRDSETAYFDFDENGWLSDNERDEDADGLTNYDETHGRMTSIYWRSCYNEERVHPIEYAGTDVADPDSDGDGVRDGADDQDHDDVPNVMELSRIAASGLDDTAGPTCRVNPELNVGNFTVDGGPLPDTSVVVTFTGELGRADQPEMIATGNFTGGTAPGVTVTTIRDGSPSANEIQAVTITGGPDGGNFTLTLGSETTTAIGYNSANESIEATLESLYPAASNSNHPNDYGRVNPFNPCLPATWSPSCTIHPSFENAGAPFDESVNWYSLN